MHTGIALVVQADDAESAVAEVENFNEHNAQWSDWNEHGGRWRDVIEGAVLRYSDNPEKFREIVEQFKGFKKAEMERYIAEVGDITIKEIVTNPKFRWGQPLNVEGLSEEEAMKAREEHLDNALKLWQAKKLLKLVDGEFGENQHFFDADAQTTEDNYLNDRIKENPDRQFLVIWDYHY
jgi:hypothetical protein